MLKSDTEILKLLKKIRGSMIENLTQAKIWYGVDSLPYHVYAKAIRDACRKIDDEIIKIETAFPAEVNS